MSAVWGHPPISRRAAIQAGSIGLLGLGCHHLQLLREASAESSAPPARSVIYIFLSGGLAQQDSFDLKPDAPDTIRGEFNPIETATPGIRICEHLPLLAKRSDLWSLVRSLTHPYNDHFQGIMSMLSGRTELPPGYQLGTPKRTDWPAIAAIAGAATKQRNNLPPAVSLPEKLAGPLRRPASGQFAGMMGESRNPWFVDASPFRVVPGRRIHGAYPEYSFSYERRGPVDSDHVPFEAPNLTLPEGFDRGRLRSRVRLLEHIEQQQRHLNDAASTQSLDRYRQSAISMLDSSRIRWAFDATRADDAIQDRYGRNSFGWSLLMARRLVEVGVNLVQVQLGNWTTWDTHSAAFPMLKNFLFPPTDKAVSALLDDLSTTGLLDDTLVVMAGEFGRTPKITRLGGTYKLPGRDHWGGVQTVFLAGGGIQGGRVIGESDRVAAYPADNPQYPENMAATIYQSLGIPRTSTWNDELDRPHAIYHGDPIPGLT